MMWEIQINGDETDLRELSKSLRENELSIEERERQYFVISSQFDGLNSSEEVRSIASEMLTILTGATKLSLGGKLPGWVKSRHGI